MYKIILLDADGTLFDYDRAEESALRKTLLQYGFAGPLDDIHRRYRSLNSALWRKLELGEITKEELRLSRFNKLFLEYNVAFDEEEFSTQYLKRLGEGTFLLEGAEEICKDLSSEFRLIILTNGMKEVQLSRLRCSLINNYIEDIITSEEAGTNKPDPQIFEYTLNRVGHKDRAQVLMVGDSLNSDIRGGLNSGIDTCWYNPGRQENHTGIEPTHSIASLGELRTILERRRDR